MLAALPATSITRAVRRATAEDLRPLHDLLSPPDATAALVPRAALEDKLENGTFLVTGDDDAMHAAVWVDIDVEPARIEHLFVARPYRGKGLGQRLLCVAEAFCRAQGSREAEVELANDAGRLLRFCRRAGYSIKESERAPSTLVLRKELDESSEL